MRSNDGWCGGTAERSHTWTRFWDLGGGNFSDKAKGLLDGRRVGVSGDAAEDFKNVNLKINELTSLGQFLIILMKILRFVQNFFKISRILREKIRAKIY